MSAGNNPWYELMRYVVTKMHRFPSEYLALSIQERALIDAIILDTSDKKVKEIEKINKSMKG